MHFVRRMHFVELRRQIVHYFRKHSVDQRNCLLKNCLCLHRRIYHSMELFYCYRKDYYQKDFVAVWCSYQINWASDFPLPNWLQTDSRYLNYSERFPLILRCCTGWPEHSANCCSHCSDRTALIFCMKHRPTVGSTVATVPVDCHCFSPRSTANVSPRTIDLQSSAVMVYPWTVHNMIASTVSLLLPLQHRSWQQFWFVRDNLCYRQQLGKYPIFITYATFMCSFLHWVPKLQEFFK